MHRRPPRLHNSIVFQPGVAILWTGTGVAADPRTLLVGDGHALVDLAARNIRWTADPLFVAPAQGDFRPQPDSQAVNAGGATASSPTSTIRHGVQP